MGTEKALVAIVCLLPILTIATAQQKRIGVKGNLNTYPDNPKECVFPVIYNGKTYTDCTDDDWSQEWCSSSTAAGDKYITGEYLNCYRK